jgi:isopentenyl diphosphate isomerase/L-lactate dehydrogenase-like FMN-dependent dehydrogenase
VLRLFDADIRRTLALCGVISLAELDQRYVRWRT